VDGGVDVIDGCIVDCYIVRAVTDTIVDDDLW